VEHEARRVVVLVEGRSDAVAVEALAAGRGLDTTDGVVQVVAMGGVTNIRSHLLRQAEQAEVHVLGLCDAPEERYFVRALQETGRPVTSRAEMATLGFFVCVQDLEDELMRALGPEAVEDALSELGHLGRFRTFQRQPEWRDRDLPDQLHRFAGSGSGRKLALATRLARELTPATTPQPLAALVDRMVSAVR
jgi:hypothetical protein